MEMQHEYKTMSRVLLLIVAAASGAYLAFRVSQPSLKDWRVEHHVFNDGGADNFLLTLTNDGQLVVENKRIGKRTVKTASPGLRKRIANIVRDHDLSSRPSPERVLSSNSSTTSSALIIRGQRYLVVFPQDVNDLLFSSLQDALTDPAPVKLNLGRAWKIEEGFAGDEAEWQGVWVRRGQSNLFDAKWNNRWLNENQGDVIEVEVAENGQVILFRQGIKMHYRGSYSQDQPQRLSGTADWYGPGVIWRATIEY
jgi:hypothetical protein